ncbi:MAG: hypothetical protein IT467_06685 [Dokdonella sp.]|uniref:hypothetical protein n=1 Tax=Dokdonella sp. TaxID=2291710 RepID=UPI0025BEFB6F|nr:hypothetical protein [Dokdonella sp.]MBZ0224294.1 hypothetical protein [Dokdonella sp.]MCC7255605.1 hypothetical protein [Dokdonella sp.]
MRVISLRPRSFAAVVLLGALLPPAIAQLPLPTTPTDFHVPGTQVGDMPLENLIDPSVCRNCHGNYEPAGSHDDIHASWAGSLMGLGGKDPLYIAQVTNANQDVANVGSFCTRCHLPVAVVTGHVAQADGSTLDAQDKQGVTCHFCHSMVDPVYKSGVSPAEDESILAALDAVPQYASNAMFVLDPEGRRRGPRADANPMHEFLVSPFHRDAALCGTCHDVGNVAVSKQGNGTYRYNALDTESPTHDPAQLFPLERTFTEWKLSSFASTGVDLGGRFGGTRGPIVSTCQSCHMPGVAGRPWFGGAIRPDLASHEFAGAAVPSLDLIAAFTANDPDVDPAHIAVGRAKALSMLQRAASVELTLNGNQVTARVTNHTGHKLPTGHIEGRRVWLNLRYYDAAGNLIGENGHYDPLTAHLDEASTTVYEMLVGLSNDAATATGLPVGVTTHMALADTIEKDTRIPPRGFNNAAFEAAGAPVVGIAYADGQYWHEQAYTLPANTLRVTATLYYQTLTRHYIEALRDGNVTDNWGDLLHTLWENTGKGAPIAMTTTHAFSVDAIFDDGFDAP